MIRKRVLDKVQKRQRLIPCSIYSEDTNSSPCSICLEDFSKGDKVSLLSCGHMFHYDCIIPWLAEKSFYCPICRECPYRGKDIVRTLIRCNRRSWVRSAMSKRSSVKLVCVLSVYDE